MSFSLPTIELGSGECQSYGKIPTPFEYDERVTFVVHPDCVHVLGKSWHHRFMQTKSAPLLATPTSSPRTVLVEKDDWTGFIKLDYPFVLGRFPRHLFGDKLRRGVDVSQALIQSNAEAREIFHFPETGALEIDADGRAAGLLFREASPHEKRFDRYIPFFSLFGRDYFNDSPSMPLVLKEAEKFAGIDWVRDAILLRLIDSFWRLVTEFALWPEPHAQNIILGVNGDGSTGIIWRDGQGFWSDECFNHASGYGAAGRFLKKNELESSARRSYLYDCILGGYVLEPLCAAIADGDAQLYESLRSAIATQTRQVLSKLEKSFLPEKAFRMTLEEPKGRYLPLEPTDATPYR